MPTTDTTVSRLQLIHPDLNHDGGTGLHTKVRNAWTKIGDNLNDRFFTVDALADAASQDFEHNFKSAFDQLSVLLFLRDTGTGELTRINAASTPPITSFNIAATPGSETTSIRVTNNSGAARDLAVVVELNGGGSAGGGSGGGAFAWREPPAGDPPPTRSSQDGELVYVYEPGGKSNRLVAYFKVPESYLPGTQINMDLAYFSPSTTGNVLWSGLTTLIRKGSDAIDSAVNQHASTNAAVANGGVANRYNETTVDLTESDGQVNGVSLSPGDLLRIELRRGLDTDAANVSLIASATEVS